VQVQRTTFRQDRVDGLGDDAIQLRLQFLDASCGELTSHHPSELPVQWRVHAAEHGVAGPRAHALTDLRELRMSHIHRHVRVSERFPRCLVPHHHPCALVAVELHRTDRSTVTPFLVFRRRAEGSVPQVGEVRKRIHAVEQFFFWHDTPIFIGDISS
jgi:hypothetical protein